MASDDRDDSSGVSTPVGLSIQDKIDVRTACFLTGMEETLEYLSDTKNFPPGVTTFPHQKDGYIKNLTILRDLAEGSTSTFLRTTVLAHGKTVSSAESTALYRMLKGLRNDLRSAMTWMALGKSIPTEVANQVREMIPDLWNDRVTLCRELYGLIPDAEGVESSGTILTCLEQLNETMYCENQREARLTGFG